MEFVADGEVTPGVKLVMDLLRSGGEVRRELTPRIAGEAIEGLEHLELPWLVGQIIESGERFAEQVPQRRDARPSGGR